MLDKLLGIESRFEQLEESFSIPEVTGNAERFREMMKEHKSLLRSLRNSENTRGRRPRRKKLSYYWRIPTARIRRSASLRQRSLPRRRKRSPLVSANCRYCFCRATRTTIKTSLLRYAAARAVRKRLSLRRSFTECTQCTLLPRASNARS